MNKDQKKLGLLCFSSQPGKSVKTFCEGTFRQEVEMPIRDLLATGILDKVLVVVMTNRESAESEVTFVEYCQGEGLPPHVFSPTSIAVTTLLSDERKAGRVDSLNVWHLNSDMAMQHAASFLKNQGVGRIVVKYSRIDFPTPSDLAMLFQSMEFEDRELLILAGRDEKVVECV